MFWKYRTLTIIALIAFAVLTALDCLTTWNILSAGGVELNPIMAPVIEFLLLIKMGAILAVSAIAILCERARPGAGPVVYALPAICTGIPVVWNLSVISGGVI
jgi:hypothetical protein